MVNVYDESKDGPILCTRFEYPSVEYMVRRKHVFDTWTTYSFNTHFKNGLVFMDMIPSPHFNYNELYTKYAKTESNIISDNLQIRGSFPDAKIQTINE